MNSFLKYSGVVALVILAILIVLNMGGKSKTVFGSTACSNITCLSGGLRLVTGAGGDFETDVAAVFNSTMTAVTATFSGTVQTDGGFIQSSTSATSTITSAQTLIPSDISGFNTVILTPNVSSDTVTLFASSTASAFLPVAGDSQQTCIMNGTTTAGINITLAGGTGTTLLVASSSATAVGSLVIAPQKIGCITFTRGNATATTFDILAALTVFK